MPCYKPLDGWRASTPNERGKYPLVFTRGDAQQDEPIKVACGRCIGCRLEYSRQWAMRCMYEASLHEDNCFITLTYNEENLPTDGSLNKHQWQQFMKKLRQNVRQQEINEYQALQSTHADQVLPKLKHKKIRFFMCGEYGENQDLTTLKTIGRPHYHAIIFGHDFEDKEAISKTKSGEPLYTSQKLQKLWPHGFVSIGTVTMESAAYVARYATKKITGEEAEDHYETYDTLTGEIGQLMPEFSLSSRGGKYSKGGAGGIASEWFKKYRHDLDKNFLTVNGVKMAPPKYFKELYEKHHDDEYMFIKRSAQEAIDIMDPENSPERLAVKEEIKQRTLKKLKRNLQC